MASRLIRAIRPRGTAYRGRGRADNGEMRHGRLALAVDFGLTTARRSRGIGATNDAIPRLLPPLRPRPPPPHGDGTAGLLGWVSALPGAPAAMAQARTRPADRAGDVGHRRRRLR